MKNKQAEQSLKNKAGNFLSKLIYKFRSLSFIKHILFFYLFITILGSLLLFLPAAQTGILRWQEGANGGTITKRGYIGFTDALFTAASAFSDTGLVTFSTSVTFNYFGQAIIAMLIFTGGIGWFALKVYIFNILFGRPISLRTRNSLAAERGSRKIGVTPTLIKVAVTTLFVITAVGAISLSLYFYYSDIPNISRASRDGTSSLFMKDFLYENPYHNAPVALRFGFFHAISALNNAGFDIMGNASLTPYYYNYGLQIIFITLFVIGGMGFPVIYDIYGYIMSKANKQRFRFSLFTKLSVTTYFIVAALGLGIVFLTESLVKNDGFWTASKARYGTKGNKSMALFFNTMSTRNAGFATISIHDLSGAVLFQYIIMMFIGSAPSSTAGGIRTTTMAIVVLGVYSRFRGRKSVFAFKRKIDPETVNNSYVVFTMSIIIVSLGALICVSSLDVNGGAVQSVQGLTSNSSITGSELANRYGFTEIIFEVGSAFGTTGLSTGLTSQINTASKITLVLIMFIGQLGVSSTILVWGRRKTSNQNISRVVEHVNIG